MSVGTVLTSRQIRWSPNFSRTIDSDAIGKWGVKGLVLPHCINIWEGGIRPPCPIACSTPGSCVAGRQRLRGGKVERVWGISGFQGQSPGGSGDQSPQ